MPPLLELAKVLVLVPQLDLDLDLELAQAWIAQMPKALPTPKAAQLLASELGPVLPGWSKTSAQAAVADQIGHELPWRILRERAKSIADSCIGIGSAWNNSFDQ